MKDKIYRLLEKNPYGLTIQELSKQLRITRNTVSIGLAELKGARLLEIRKIGKAKLHYLYERNLEVGKLELKQ
ncbi:MAG: HTH domain-containing protein [Thaumarchaeota archaeon]|nr:HTH domain-containing protein [Nitrososphaerota archaeon]